MKTLLARFVLIGGLLLPGALAGTAGEPPAPESSAVPGTITLSDRSVLTGEVSLTPGKPLRVWLTQKKTYRDFPLQDLTRIACAVAQTRREKEWYFKEEGNPEKVYTGRTYVRLDFSWTLTLKASDRQPEQKLECGLHGGQPIRIRLKDGTVRKFILQPYAQGEVGQTASQIVYPAEIVLGIVAPKAAAPEMEAKTAEAPSAPASVEASKPVMETQPAASPTPAAQ